MLINFGRSKLEIFFLLLLIALLPIQIVFGQFGLNNLVNRGKSIFGSIFGQNSPKNEQNKLAKTTTIPFPTISPNSFVTMSTTINSNFIGNFDGQTNANFGSTTPSIMASQSPQNNKTFPSFTTTNPFLINNTEINVKHFGQQMMPKNESIGFWNANQSASTITTSNGFPPANLPQFGKIFESTFSANLSSIPANSSPSTNFHAPLFTTIPPVGFDRNNFSRPNPFNNANTSFNHFGPTNSTPISTPIYQQNSSQFLIPTSENQTNHWNSFDSKLGHNASNELNPSTMAFTNKSQNGNQFNEFPAPKPFSLEKGNQTNEHSRGENFGNKTNEQTFNGNGTLKNAASFSFPPPIPQFNQTFPFTKHPNAISSPAAEQQFPSPSSPQQNKFTHFFGNNSANQSNWRTNSPLNNIAAQNSNEHFELNNATNLTGNWNEKKSGMNNLVQQKAGEEMGNEENKTEFGKNGNGKNNKIEQELGKQFGNNLFGNGGRMNGTTKIEGEAGKMAANWNQNQQQINEFENGTMENGKRIEMKKNMSTGSEKGIRNEIMEIKRTNENNGTKMVDGIEAKIKWENKNGSNKMVGKNETMNGLEENQLNQSISNGQRTMVGGIGQNKLAGGGQWEANQNQNAIGEIPANQSQSIGFRPNGTLSSAKGIQQPNGKLTIQQEANQNRSEGQKGNQNAGIQNNQTLLGGLQQNQGNSDGGIGFDPFQTANQTQGQNKSLNAFQPNQTQSQMPNGQNSNILAFTTSTEQNTTPTIPMATTTTQDPIVRKELEKAGAPEVLKQLVPPKAEPISEQAKQIIEDKCANGKCLEQKPEFKEQRMVVVKQEQAVEQKLNPGKPVEQVQKEVEQRISKTFQLKKELMKSAGLEGKVEPANNGVFQADLLLTEEQASALIAELERQRMQKEGGGGGRKKRAGNAVFMENSASQRWPLNTPIQFMFDQSLAEKDRQAVRQAIAEIQSKTCLKFVEARTKPPGPHLYYTKIANPTFCGLSYVGRIEPANPVYLSFMCGNEAGIGLHETLHALGFQHEQLRFDRDQFITIQWENVNPQQLDFFAISDVTKFSSYGLRYDYGSIMHYSGTIASQNPGKKTMAAKLAPAINDPLMGQRKGLSQSDVEALNKMYCSPGCEDKLVYCGLWATLNLCNPQMWRRAVTHQWIVSNCQKSCNKCGEKLEPVPNRPF